MYTAILLSIFIVTILIFISSIDDLLIDVISMGLTRLQFSSVVSPPLATTARDGDHLSPRKENEPTAPVMAVFVANWHEEEVLEKMVEGNLARIPFANVKLFLGVYPNDTGTRAIAEQLAARFPERVTAIVNRLPGPTSKGQMLNEMFLQVYSTPDRAPDFVILHDSEDVIDPRSFAIYEAFARENDFIQIPVFSFESRQRSRVAATYMDEFAERHTREMIVRNSLGAVIPSAGVGTCISKEMIMHFLNERHTVLSVGCVTEDYILGVEAKRAGFKSAFAAVRSDVPGEGYIATREFFPKGFMASVKQKTRWVFGINFEASHKLGWHGSGWDKYFFYRDRKGVITNFLPPISLLLLAFPLFGLVDLDDMPEELIDIMSIAIAVNVFALFTRYLIRMLAFKEVHDEYDPIGVAIRWPVAMVVNAMAAYRAWRSYVVESQFATRPIAWSKTTHELPEIFANNKT